MSYTVVYGQRAEEFSLEVGIEGVQAFFGVRGGGLFRNGSGLVSLPEDGGVYELQKTIRVIHWPQEVERVQTSLGNALNIKVQYTTLVLPGEGLVAEKEMAKDLDRPSRKALASSSSSSSSPSSPVAPVVERRRVGDKVEWTVLITATMCIMAFLLVLVGYLLQYDATLELSKREDMDQMTVVSVTILMISIVFGFLAFFH